MATTSFRSAAETEHPPTSGYGERLDPFDDAQQPRCPECGTVMRDVPGGWQCGGCGHSDYPTLDGRPQPIFDGPSINGG